MTSLEIILLIIVLALIVVSITFKELLDKSKQELVSLKSKIDNVVDNIRIQYKVSSKGFLRYSLIDISTVKAFAISSGKKAEDEARRILSPLADLGVEEEEIDS